MKHQFRKSLSVSIGVKSAMFGAEITPEVIAKINSYALSDLSAEKVYVRKFLLAHNLVDRDRERFSEELLDDFAITLPGKSFLFAHDRHNYLPIGLFFDAETEEMSPEQFKALTNEEPRLPDNIVNVKVLWAWYYIIKEAGYDDTIKNLEGGTYRHASIGFSASDLAPVKGPYDQTLFWEYAAPGEATEGSLVWLGAQNGATSQKSFKENHKHDGGTNNMKKLFASIGKILGKAFTETTPEETVIAEIESVISEKDAKISDLEKQITDSKGLIEIAEAHQKDLIDNYTRMRVCLEECEDTDEAKTAMGNMAKGMPYSFLKGEVDNLTKRMEKQFPDQGQLNGDTRRDKTADSGDGKDTEDNPLIPEK